MFAKNIKNSNELKEVVQKLIGIEDVRIIKEKIMVGSILKIGKGYFKIAGNAGESIKLHNFNQLYLPFTTNTYVKLLSKYYEMLKNKEKPNIENDKIMIKTNRFSKKTYLNKEENAIIFSLLVSHLNKPIYADISNVSQLGEFLKTKKEKFNELNIDEQLEVIKGLFDIINGCNGGDLSKIGGARVVGTMRINKKINDKNISLVSTSITGFYKKEELISNGI